VPDWFERSLQLKIFAATPWFGGVGVMAPLALLLAGRWAGLW